MIISEMLTPVMKLVIIMNHTGPLRNKAETIGIPIDPTNMRSVISNIFHDERFVSSSVSA